MEDLYRRYLTDGERAGSRYALGLPRQAPVGAVGASYGQRAGSSLEFRDHRDYQPGDDLRHIDWSAYARSDQLTVKLYREEVTPHVDLLLDVSRSMALEGTAKAAATLGLAGLFTAAANNAGYSHAAWKIAEGIEPVGNGRAGPTEWAAVNFGHRGGPGAIPPAWRPRGVRVLVSDLLWPGEPLHLLRPLADRASSVIVLQVLAAADVGPGEGQSLRLVDVETDQVQEVHVDAVAAQRYRAALSRHQQHWHTACRQVGAIFSIVVAEKLLAEWRLDELVAAEVLRVF